MRIIMFFLSAIVLGSCGNNSADLVVRPNQILPLLEEYPEIVTDELTEANNDLFFWKEKLRQNPAGFLYAEKMSASFDKRFRLKGDIEDIDSSNYFLQQAVDSRNNWKINKLRYAQIANLIKLHQFKRAEQLCLKGLERTPGNLGFQLLWFDVLMELGEYEEAQRIIVDISKSNNDYDVIIRQAKFFDYLGRLDRTLELMAKADSMVMKSNDPGLKAWTKTILGEYLTHSGAIEEGYQQFMQAVQLDPTQEYAWLNLAWIAYAHDDNTVLYERILSTLDVKSTPDLLWELAHLYKRQRDQRYYRNIMSFYEVASQPKYKGWYEPKLIQIESEQMGNHKKALQMARKQVEIRPTLESYDLLGWSLYQAGDFDSAKAVFERHLYQKTDEPLIQYHGGEIYMKTSDFGKAGWLLAQAAEARFELGPDIFERIKDLGKQIP